MSKLLILGGSDAGISAALRARELDTTGRSLSWWKMPSRTTASVACRSI